MTGEVKNITDMSGPSKTSHVFIAINISSFIDAETYKNNVDLVVESIKALPPKADNQIFMAGEIEQNLTEKRIKEGIPVEVEVIETLNELAEKYKASKL